MRVFACTFLLPLIVTAVENLPLVKRELDHRSNIALLNNLSFGAGKPVDVVNPSPAPNVANVENLTEGTIPVTINTESLALGNPNALTNEAQFTYAPSFPQNVPLVNTQPLDNNVVYVTGQSNQNPAIPYANILVPSLPLVTAPNTNFQNTAVNTVQDNRNILQTYAPQNFVGVPQSYPVQFIREVKVPQPYPVHITRTVQVPVHIRVPVEVPKPYPVKVPHPVPVPVHVKVPVPVEKPYPVHITKTVAVPVEKPVYIKVPQPIQVPVPQPYPVAVPQPVQVQVPFVVRFSDATGEAVPNFQGAQPIVPNFEGVQAPVAPNLDSIPLPLQFPAVAAGTPALPELNSIAGPTTECGSCNDKVDDSTTTSKPSLLNITGNGLLPPHPPSNSSATSNSDKGLLDSYVSSKDGGVYRRSTEYQTMEYKKTW